MSAQNTTESPVANHVLPSAQESTQVTILRGDLSYADSAAVTDHVRRALDALPAATTIVKPGDKVVIKPNWVKEHDTRYAPESDTWLTVITHPEVILATCRWVAPRLQGKGSITICDAPQSDSSFARIRRYCKLDDLLATCRAEFPAIQFELFEMRSEEWDTIDGITVSKTILPGDPAGAVNIHLDEDSEFLGYKGLGKLYGAAYDFAETNKQHQDPNHEYLLCRTPLTADLLINIPKLKTHKKVGLTVALKNMVGITARTNWLPRHTEGTPDQGGDQFATSAVKHKLEHKLMGSAKAFLKGRHFLSRFLVPLKKLGRLYFGDTEHIVRSGNWHGNDTAWRMILDLHKCITYFDADGQPRKQPLRQLTVVDGIIAGEGNGPMAPDAKPCGVIMAGTHPVAIDCAAASLMGFDWQKLRLLRGAFAINKRPITNFPYEAIRILSDNASWDGPLDQLQDNLKFRPHFGWKGHIEKTP